MDKYKITDSELESGVVAAPNILNDTPQENKSVFDRLPRLIATKMNGFIDAVISKFTDYYNKTETEQKINEKVLELENGDMAKAVYDPDEDGVVTKAMDAEKLNGQPASFYAFADNAVKKDGDIMTGALTLHSDPTEDLHAATKQYVDNKTDKDLLWENASPTSSFAEQAITIPNLTNYKEYEILCKQDKKNERYFTFKSKVGLGTLLYNVAGYNKEIFSRNVIVNSAEPTILNFATTYQGSTHKDDCLIPYEIYGIK